MSTSESIYFPHDREKLMNTLARFDDGIAAEDVIGIGKESDDSKYSHTVLIQVLLEFMCHAFVKNEDHRETLLKEVCRRLSNTKFVNDFLPTEKTIEMRAAMKKEVINFMKQVCDEVIPKVELDTSVVGFFESNNISAELSLYYCKKFIELERIGEGGFGVVFKAQYKLNNLIYAVKKISFNYKNDACFLKVMREANNIAVLDHPNIVRYHSAWLEMARADTVKKALSSSNDSSDNSDVSDDNGISKQLTGLVIKTDACSSETSDCLRTIVVKQSLNESSSSVNSDCIIFSESAEFSSNDINFTIGNDSASFISYSIDEATSNESEDKSDSPLTLTLNVEGTLYIQMEFCDCDLRVWLDKRTEGSKLPFEMDVTDIFTNILNGVAHIHSKHIIHRDLKPQNIFYSTRSNCLKIGDFGLATLSEYSVNTSNDVSSIYSTALGTLPYAAPEQLKSKNYGEKVDIYSLGIILIELMNICSTKMEFFDIITDVKKAIIREEMKKLPKLVNIVQNLIKDDPNERMSAKEILDIFDKDSKALLKEKEETIKHMEATLHQQAITIQQLHLEIAGLKKIADKLRLSQNATI